MGVFLLWFFMFYFKKPKIIKVLQQMCVLQLREANFEKSTNLRPQKVQNVLWQLQGAQFCRNVAKTLGKTKVLTLDQWAGARDGSGLSV